VTEKQFKTKLGVSTPAVTFYSSLSNSSIDISYEESNNLLLSGAITTTGNITAPRLEGSADTLTTARNIALTGAITGNVDFNGSQNVSLTTTANSSPTLTLAGDLTGSATFTNLGNTTLTASVQDNSHNHVISNIDGLQTALDQKLSTTGKAADAELLDGSNSSSFLRSDESGTLNGSLSIANGLAVDTDTLYADSISNRVGIGTDVPLSPLHIEGSFNSGFFLNDTGGTNADMIMSDTGGSNRIRCSGGGYAVYVGGDAASSDAANSVQAFRVISNGDIDFIEDDGVTVGARFDASSGNLGIGTFNPAQKLHVEDSADLSVNFRSTGGNTNLFLRAQDAGFSQMFFGDTTAFNAGFIQYAHTNDSFIYRNGGGSHRFQVSATEVMRIDSTGNVGIGTSSPVIQLDQLGDSLMHRIRSTTSTSAYARYEGTSGIMAVGILGGLGYVGTTDASDLRLLTNSSEVMRIDSSGNVGIGTSNPAHLLTVGEDGGSNPGEISLGRGGVESASIYWTRVGTNDAEITYTADEDLVIKNAFNGGAVEYTNNNGNHIFNTGASGSTEAMRIDSSGNVGIGTSTPGQSLDVAGNIRLSGQSTDSQYLLVGSGRTGNGFSYIDLVGDTTYPAYGLRVIRNNGGPNTLSRIQHRGTGALQIMAQDAGNIVLMTDASERMRVTSTGDVGIGTSTPAHQLEVENSTGSAIIAATSSTSGTSQIRMGDTANTGSGRVEYDNSTNTMKLCTSGSERFNISSAGIVTISGGSLVLNGTGRIQGIDTVTDSTDAASKGYVDSRAGSLDVNIISSNTTAVSGNHYYISAAGVQLTLPSSPSVGDRVGVSEIAGDTTSSILRNGNNIMGLSEDLTIDTAYFVTILTYIDASNGWAFS